MMKISQLALLFAVLCVIDSYQSITVERIDQISLDYDWSDGVNNMAILDGRAYLTRPLSYEVYVVHLARKQEVRRLGGQGKGPGEFDMFVGGVYKVRNGIAATSANWIHFFDRNGRFQNKVFLKNASTTTLSSLPGDQYVVGTHTFLGDNKLETISNVGTLKSRTAEIIDYTKFGNRNQIANMTLNSYVIDSDDRYVVIGQIGSNELRYLNHNGALVRKVSLSNDPSKIKFRDVPEMASETYTRLIKQHGIELDQRLPSFGIVMNVALTPNRTFVLGVFEHNGSNKRLAMINHSTWNVDYVNLGAGCRSMTVENDLMYCLNAPPNKTPQIDVYRIKAN